MGERSRKASLLEKVDYGFVVENREDGTAQVMLPRRKACQTDDWSKDICDQLDKGHLILRALNPIQALKGTKVEIRFVTQSLSKSIFIVYILPILSLIVGAILGGTLNPFGDQDLSAVFGSAVLFIICLGLMLGIYIKNWRQKSSNMPKITKILK